MQQKFGEILMMEVINKYCFNQGFPTILFSTSYSQSATIAYFSSLSRNELKK